MQQILFDANFLHFCEWNVTFLTFDEAFARDKVVAFDAIAERQIANQQRDHCTRNNQHKQSDSTPTKRIAKQQDWNRRNEELAQRANQSND